MEDGTTIVITCVQEETRPVITLKFEDDQTADLWHNAITIASQWWADNRQKRATMLLMSPAGSGHGLGLSSIGRRVSFENPA